MTYSSKKASNFLLKNSALLFILIFAFVLLTINITKPFIGHHDWNGAWYSTFARNFIEHGLINTKLGSVLGIHDNNATNFNYFTHYPPLLPVLLFLSFKIFGISEWAARIVPIAFSLGTILVIYILGIQFFNRKTALLAALLSCFLPIVIYYGKMPVQEVLVIAPVLLSVFFYFQLVEKKSKKTFLYLFLSLSLAHLINWPGYYITPIFFMHYLIFGKRRNKLKIAIIFPAISVLFFIFHAIHTFFLTGDLLGGGLISVLLFRLNMAQKPEGYTTINFIKNQAAMIQIYYTRTLLLFVGAAALWTLLILKKRKFPKNIQVLTVLFVFGITHNLVFRNMAYIHDYMIIYLWPFIALSGSFGFFLVLEKLRIKSALAQATFIFLLVSLMTLERKDFTRALLSSDSFRSGMELGKFINNNTTRGDKVLVLSYSFKEQNEVFVQFYGNRNIDYQLAQASPGKIDYSDYKYIVASPSQDTPKSVIDDLACIYPKTRINELEIFKIN